MYIADTQEKQKKANESVLTSTGLEGSFSVSRRKRKSTDVKTSVMHNTNSISTSKSSKKVEDYVRRVNNKHLSPIFNFKINACNHKIDYANVKKVNASCESYTKSMFDNCHDKCVAKYVIYVKSKARRALFTSLLAMKTRFVDATPIAAKTSSVTTTLVNAKDKASSSTFKSTESSKVSTPS
ncbi:hypothetical protein Tco_1021331 [Tanacetum coccineum]